MSPVFLIEVALVSLLTIMGFQAITERPPGWRGVLSFASGVAMFMAVGLIVVFG